MPSDNRPSITSDSLDIDAEKAEMSELIERIISKAKASGATAAEVGVSKQVGLSTKVRKLEVETVEFNRDYGFGITVYIGHQKGSSSTSDTSDSAIVNAVEAALAIARETSSDPCSGLADPDKLAINIPDLELDHPQGLLPEQAIEEAKICEQAILDADKRIQSSDGVTYASHRGIRMYGNSNGFLAGYPSTRHYLSALAIARDEKGMQRDYYYTVSRKADELLSSKEVGEKAAELTLARLDSQTIKTGVYPVLFVPELAAGLLGHLCSAISGGSQYRKSSFLLDYLGRDVFPEFVNIYEEPHLKCRLGSAPFDSEGVITRDQHFIKDGQLCSYILSSYSARRLGLETTGNAGGTHNLAIDSTGQSFEELLEQLGTGLVVTEVMGQGVNLVTGDYSRGASGFWVENGKIQHPVEELTVASNLKEMFMSLQAVGNDIDSRLSTRTGSMLIPKMTVATSH